MSLRSILLSLCVVVALAVQPAVAQEVVAKDKEVSIEYTLKLEDGTVVDSNVGKKPLTYVHGRHQIIPGLEKALEGMKVGESKKVVVPPEQAYGPVDKSAFLEVKKDQIPPEALKVGAYVQGRGARGEVLIARVVEIKKDTVLLDFNHPLAGKTLYFDVKILDIKTPAKESKKSK